MRFGKYTDIAFLVLLFFSLYTSAGLHIITYSSTYSKVPVHVYVHVYVHVDYSSLPVPVLKYYHAILAMLASYKHATGIAHTGTRVYSSTIAIHVYVLEYVL